MTALVRVELTEEQAQEVHQALVERQARKRLDLLQAKDAGPAIALMHAIEANATVARQLARALGYSRDDAPAVDPRGGLVVAVFDTTPSLSIIAAAAEVQVIPECGLARRAKSNTGKPLVEVRRHDAIDDGCDCLTATGVAEYRRSPRALASFLHSSECALFARRAASAG